LKALGVVRPWLASRRNRIRVLLLASYQNVAAIADGVVDFYGQPLLGRHPQDSAQAVARLLTALDRGDRAAVRSKLSRLNTTPIVWGTGDVFFPVKSGRRLAALIPGARGLITVPGGRLHFPDYRAHEMVGHLRQHWD
jgi:pimeloyl-ACP methyl ester carboxylesterase